MHKIGAFYLWSEKPALNPFSSTTRTTNRIRKKLRLRQYHCMLIGFLSNQLYISFAIVSDRRPLLSGVKLSSGYLTGA